MKNVLIGLVLVAVVGVGAYYFAYQKGPANAPTEPSAAAPAPASQVTVATGDTSVRIKSFAFNPVTIIVKKGAKVTWTNDDSVPHSVTSDSGFFDSKVFNKGQSYSFTFATAGTFAYHCSVHPSMKAIVVVED